MEEKPVDKITLGKAVSGIGAPKNFVKLTVQCVNVGLVILMIMGGLKIWSILFPKKVTQTQTQTSSFVVEEGATVESLTVVSSQDQKAPQRRVGLGIRASNDDATMTFKKYVNDTWHVGIGARWLYEDPGDDIMQVSPVVEVGVDFY